MHNSDAEKETAVIRTEMVLPVRKQRRIVIVETFHPDQEAMQEALEWLMRKSVKKQN